MLLNTLIEGLSAPRLPFPRQEEGFSRSCTSYTVSFYGPNEPWVLRYQNYHPIS